MYRCFTVVSFQPLYLHQGENPTVARNTRAPSDDVQVVGNELVTSDDEVSQTTDDLITSGEGHVVRLLTNQSLKGRPGRGAGVDGGDAGAAGTSTCSPLLGRSGTSTPLTQQTSATAAGESNSLLTKLKRFVQFRSRHKTALQDVTSDAKLAKKCNETREAVQLARRRERDVEAVEEDRPSNLVLASRELTVGTQPSSTGMTEATQARSANNSCSATARRPESLQLNV